MPHSPSKTGVNALMESGAPSTHRPIGVYWIPRSSRAMTTERTCSVLLSKKCPQCVRKSGRVIEVRDVPGPCELHIAGAYEGLVQALHRGWHRTATVLLAGD